MKITVSVLMSVYKKEHPEFFKQSLESIFKQTKIPNEIVLVKDGPLTSELEMIIEQMKPLSPCFFNVISLPENVGLGRALNIGVKNCQYEYIARMDTDDIARKDRLELQENIFLNNTELVLLGSNIEEFNSRIGDINRFRNVPETYEEILMFSKKRNPFNHMTVMFKKEQILLAGNYQPLEGFEDYYLWIRVIQKGYEVSNLSEVLVFARVGNDMVTRRGGVDYLKKSIQAKKTFKEIQYLTKTEYYISLCGSIIGSMLPKKIRNILYTKILRK